MSRAATVPMRVALNRALAMVAALAITASLLAVLTTGVVLLRGYAGQNLELIGRQAAYSVEVAVVFNDEQAVADALAPTIANPAVRGVIVRRSDGSPMFNYNPGNGQRSIWGRISETVDPLPVTIPIRTTGTAIGTIGISGHTSGIGTLLIASLIGAIAALSLAFFATRMVGARLRRTIIAPLQAIADAAHGVRNERSFERRAPRAAVSEVDALAIDFNALLDELTDWQNQVAEAHGALVQRANFDPLSGLSNRASFIEHVRDAIKASQRTGDRFAILFMDGDRFKETNDRFGHAAGDAVIAEVAKRLSPLLRVGDIASRVGGDEFAVLIHHLEDDVDATAVAERIDEAMRAPIAISDTDAVTIGLSIGIAIHPDHGSEVDALMSHADAAMYVAKSARRGDANDNNPEERADDDRA